MKASALTYLLIVTGILLTVAIFAALDFPFRFVFYLTVIGQVTLIYSVVNVLKDNYTTDKTFEDFYEDFPISERNNFR
ncbi:hypothetical protein [Aequorivita flava]